MKEKIPEKAINLIDVSKSYGDKKVLESVNLSVEPGEIVGILGRNGAGKSTLINIMNALIHQSSGEVMVWGKNPLRYSIGRYVGYAPQDISIYPHLTVRQNLQCMGEIQGLSYRRAGQESKTIAQLLGLERIMGQNASTLSGGQKRRLHTGMALMHKPRIAFLDEPTVAADVEARNQILETVKYLAQQGTTVIYTSHYLSEFETLDARIAVLDNGRIVADGPLEKIVNSHSQSTIRVQCDSRSLPRIQGWAVRDNYLELNHAVGNQSDEIMQLLAHPEMKDVAIANIDFIQPSLENAYLNIINAKEQ